MVTAVDSSVLLDVLLDDPLYANTSQAALRQANAEGSLVLCETVLAEICPALNSRDLPVFLSDWGLAYVPSSQVSAVLAGQLFRQYLERGGRRGRVVADFVIGAHAQTHASRLLARDRGFYRDYFKKLEIWIPGQD